MKQISIILFLFLIFNHPAKVNAQCFWAKQMGSTGTDVGNSVAVDAYGNVYVTGNFTGTSDFDPSSTVNNLISNGSGDIFITKFSSSGSLLWAKQIGGTNNDIGYSLTIDMLGNICISGIFDGIVDFDPDSGIYNLTAGSVSGFICKLDSGGSFIWVRQFSGNSGSIRPFSITTDGLGNILFTGWFNDSQDFDPSQGTFLLNSSSGTIDIFVCKISAGGAFIWAKSVGGYGNEVSNSITVDIKGNVYFTGYFQSTVDFDPGNTVFNLVAQSNDFFVCKLDSAGNFVWVKQIEAAGNEEGKSVAVDNQGNVYTTGYFGGTGDFNPSNSIFNLTASGVDVFILKLDSLGGFIWAKNFGGVNIDYGNSISLDSFGYLYATGFFQGTVDFDPGPAINNFSAVGGNDIFIIKLDVNGNFKNAMVFGGNLGQEGNSICLDSSGNIYATGSSSGLSDFDPGLGSFNLNSIGAQDIFVLKVINLNDTIYSVFGPSSVCAGSNGVTFSVGSVLGATNYNWNYNGTGMNFNSSGDSVNTTFSQTSTSGILSVFATNGCLTTNLASLSIQVISPNSPSICAITVDSISKFNIIAWDKTGYNSPDTFIVYRDISNNNYQRIGAVSFDSLSQFVDTVASLFASNGDPNVSSWRYKLSVKDSCGNESAKSNYHQTIFIQNISGNFIWNQYQIQGQSVPVPALQNYIIYRDDFSNGNWQPIQTLSASSTAYTDPNFNIFQSIASYRVETVWNISCDPTRSLINTSRSNVKNLANPLSANAENNAMNTWDLFPNPSQNKITIELNVKQTTEMQVNLLDVHGKEVMSTQRTLSSGKNLQTLDVEDLSSGIYFVQLQVGEQVLRKKMVKE